MRSIVLPTIGLLARRTALETLLRIALAITTLIGLIALSRLVALTLFPWREELDLISRYFELSADGSVLALISPCSNFADYGDLSSL